MYIYIYICFTFSTTFHANILQLHRSVIICVFFWWCSSTLWGHTYFQKNILYVCSFIDYQIDVSLLYLLKINTSLPTPFMVNTPFAATAGPQLEPQFSRVSVIQNRWCEMFPYQAVKWWGTALVFSHTVSKYYKGFIFIHGVWSSCIDSIVHLQHYQKKVQEH